MADASPNATPRPSVSGGTPLPASRFHEDGTAEDAGGASTQRRDVRSETLKPIGIINEHNTCFLNSTFQALSSTAPLISLLTSSPTSPLRPSSSPLRRGALPPPLLSPAQIPLLHPSTLSDPELLPLLPVTRTFLASLQKAWRMKDACGGTSGHDEASSTRSMSLRSLLQQIASKYDQYDDFGQQDAHELLRHLLDSMEMEEKDVIKRLQPEALLPPNGVGARKGRRRGGRGGEVSGAGGGGRRSEGISPMVSPLPSPAASQPSSPVRQTSDPMRFVQDNRPEEVLSEEPATMKEIPDNERMVPFVDALFGGTLASVMVCEKCKSVSHTYEGFLDISLSLKDDQKPRKRDRFRAMAQRLRPRHASKPLTSSPPITDSHILTPQTSLHSVMSDTELSDSEHPPSRDRRRSSLDQDDRPGESSLSRNSSLSKGFAGLKPKASFSFRRKGSRPSSSSSSATLPGPDDKDKEKEKEKEKSKDSGGSGSLPASPNLAGHTVHPKHGAGPTPAQAAYISRILSGSYEPPDPLAKLRAAHAGEASPPERPETGLEESLRAFTSVEVLEGDNAFACKKCWKIKTGKYKDVDAVREEDELDEETGVVSPSTSPLIVASSNRVSPPSISIVGSPTDGSETLADDVSSLGRNPSLASTGSGTSNSNAKSVRIRSPSPLRRQVDSESPEPVPTTTGSTAHSSFSTTASVPPPKRPSDASSFISQSSSSVLVGADESDGLSDTSSDDEEPPKAVDLPVGAGKRPKMHARKKSTHFVMRRAFKRYLIAKEPEVLVFHFKRFKQTSGKGLMLTSFYDLKKMEDFVSFPEMLDLAPYLAPNRNDYKLNQTPHGPHAPYMDWPSPEHGPEQIPNMYRLYAVVVHLGTMIGGHYIAYCLVDPEKMFGGDSPVPTEAMDRLDLHANGNGNGNGGADQARPTSAPREDKRVWCYCSDTSIRLASVDEVLAASAYLCFYERVRQ